MSTTLSEYYIAGRNTEYYIKSKNFGGFVLLIALDTPSSHIQTQFILSLIFVLSAALRYEFGFVLW